MTTTQTKKQIKVRRANISKDALIAPTKNQTVISVSQKKISNNTRVRQVYYDGYGDTHILAPGESKIIDVIEASL